MQLEVHDLDVRYGRVHAVRGVSVTLAAGEIVAVLGANGAGKSSLLRALLGLAKPSGGQVIFDGRDVTHWSTSARVRGGLVLVPEGRRIVMTLTVHENLLMGAFNRRDGKAVAAEIAGIYERFPNLAARRHHPASVLSGGEQQMLAIGRGLLARPKVLMLDEPSLGLSPRLSNEVFALIAGLNRETRAEHPAGGAEYPPRARARAPRLRARARPGRAGGCARTAPGRSHPAGRLPRPRERRRPARAARTIPLA